MSLKLRRLDHALTNPAALNASTVRSYAGKVRSLARINR